MSKPMNSFFLYTSLHREEFKKKYPNLPNSKLVSIISEKWATMTSAEKRKYKDLAKERRMVNNTLIFFYKMF